MDFRDEIETVHLYDYRNQVTRLHDFTFYTLKYLKREVGIVGCRDEVGEEGRLREK